MKTSEKIPKLKILKIFFNIFFSKSLNFFEGLSKKYIKNFEIENFKLTIEKLICTLFFEFFCAFYYEFRYTINFKLHFTQNIILKFFEEIFIHLYDNRKNRG